MPQSSRVAIVVLLLVQSVSPGQAAGPAAPGRVTTPEKHLGRPVGCDFQLADWKEITSYFFKLDKESPNVVVEKAGKTTEGRDFILATISGAENLAHLERIKACARTIADPRGKSHAEKDAAIRDGKVIMLITCAMHSTECASPQFSMEFAYRLATSQEEPWATARQNMVVVIAPTLNPDGLEDVVSWYRKNVGTPYESAGLLKLYQYYTGHDNNRDWFMLTQAETRIMTHQLYGVWLPQVYWDVHQQGTNRERMFIPPFRDPLNPNLDPAIISGIDALCSRAMMDMTREGRSGVASGLAYDMWWNGGNRNVPVRHNMIGLLTEAASVNIATPVFIPLGDLTHPFGEGKYRPSNQFPSPWPGGWWRLRNIIDYELSFGKSLLGTLGREPQVWLRASLEAAQRNIEAGKISAPRAWIIPSDNRDPAAVRRLADVLLQGAVELHVAPKALVADGREYPAGSIVIQRGQPYGAYVKDLFDIQRYPDASKPYDVAGWTLPLLLGVRRVEVMQPINAPLKRVGSPGEAVAGVKGDPRVKDAKLLSSWDSDSWTKLAAHLQARGKATFMTKGDRQGMFVLEQTPYTSGTAIELAGLPRIGVYSPWTGHIDEGWLRYVLDTYKIPFKTVRNEMLRAGQLLDFIDVLVLPGVSSGALDQGRAAGSLPDQYAGGLAPEGAVAVEEFVRDGGTLVAMESSGNWVIDLLKLPLTDTTRSSTAKEFSCPGSVLRGLVKTDRPLAAGLPDSLSLFFSGSCAWKMTATEAKKSSATGSEVETLMEYAPTRLLLSGWISKPETLEGQMAWVRAKFGQGRVHLFGFQPQYRAWSQATFPLLFRAMLVDQH